MQRKEFHFKHVRFLTGDISGVDPEAECIAQFHRMGCYCFPPEIRLNFLKCSNYFADASHYPVGVRRASAH